MKIHGIEGMTTEELIEEVKRGGRFVLFFYVISVVVMTFKQPTGIYFIRSGEKAFGKALGPTLTSFFLGWWGFPFGLIYTIESLTVNLAGGRNVTRDIMQSFQAIAAAETPTEPAPRKPWHPKDD